jgi:hypothetical protein
LPSVPAFPEEFIEFADVAVFRDDGCELFKLILGVG